MVGTLGAALVSTGVKEVLALDLAGFIDQDSQRLAGAVETVIEESGVGIMQGIVFDSLCHFKDSFKVRGYDAAMEPPAACPIGGAAICGCPALFGR